MNTPTPRKTRPNKADCTAPFSDDSKATKSKGIDAATSLLIDMLSDLERAMKYEDMTPELAEILSTDRARLIYEVTADIEIGDEEQSSTERNQFGERLRYE